MVELISLFIPFITLFIIMDPFASIPPFLMLTRNCKEEEMKSTANKAVLIAAVIAFIFVFGGMEILKILSITLSDFKIAGGMVLVLLGLENVLNFTLSNGHNKKDVVDSVAVLIATPLLTGPGLISSLIIMVQTFAIGNVLIALSATLFISLIILKCDPC